MPPQRLGVTWRLVIGALLGLTAGQTLEAQGTIRGRVTEANSARPLADVQIVISGTGMGALTNLSGDFVIVNVPTGERELIVRRLGYSRQTRTVTITAGQEIRADFELAVSASQLEQVVVTGTGGAAEKRTLGNSITTLDVAELTARNSILNVTEVLQGKTPGVTVLPGSGAPGTAGEIRIRGASSLSGYAPVVFIDGIRMNIGDLGQIAPTGGGTLGLAQSAQTTSLLNNLNPNDIESIEVLKGPAAATLYGADAANGVIQIITKKGTQGQQRMQWTFRTESGRSSYELLPEANYTVCDSLKQEVPATAALWPGCQGVPRWTVLSGNPFADDPRAVRAGNTARTSMGLRGGGDRYSFYLSGDRTTEQGVFRNSDNANTAIRTNFRFQPNEKADIALNVNYQDGRLRLPIQDESANGLLLSARRGLPGRVSVFATAPQDTGWRTIGPDRANAYKNFTDYQRFTTGATVNYSPFSWFTNRLSAGFDRTFTQSQVLFLPGDIDVAQDPDAGSGANIRRTPTNDLITLDYAGILTASRGNYAFTTTVGSQVVSSQSRMLGATGIGIGAPDVTLPNLLQRSIGVETFSENNSVGYYVQQQVGWNDRLFLTGAVRADDHSSFGTDFDIIVYPKLSLAWVLSDEPAMQGALDALRVSTFKFRTAWGQAGRAPAAYSAPQTYTVDRVTLGTATGSALRTATFGNPNLEAERGVELELGADVGLFGERMGIDFTYYNKTTKNLLQSMPVPPSTGFVGSRLVNLGEVNNRGIELGVFGTPVQRTNLQWETRVNVATNRNELVTFGDDTKLWETPGGQAYGSAQQHRKGYPLGGYWVIPPVRDANGVPVLTAANAAIFPVGDTARRYVGPSTPTYELGFANTVTLFKYFRLYALLDMKGGHYLFNLQERNRCQAANDNCLLATNRAVRAPQTAADTLLWKEFQARRHASGIDPSWIEKADFIKLREVSLSIDAPTRWANAFRAQRATFTFSGRNLALWSDYSGADPEVNSYGGRNFVRVDAYALPMMRRLTAAIDLTY